MIYRMIGIMGALLLLLGVSMASALAPKPVHVLVWSELTEPKSCYPQGINGEIAAYLNTLPGIEAKTASINDPEQGLTDAALANTDVLLWFGHARHGDVNDQAVAKIVKRVKEGMGFIPLHSSHYSKPFKALMGAGCDLGGWREDGKPEHVKVIARSHPITRGIKDFDIPQTEMYSDPFNAPNPETLIFRSHWDRGETFSGSGTWTVGKGRVFYFRPGHETFPIFRQPEVQRIVRNACFWAAQREGSGLESVVDYGAAPEKIASGLKFTEGPVWSRQGYLLFSDVHDDTAYKWTPDGKLEVFRKPSNNSNGLTFDLSGSLIACEHTARRVTRTGSKGEIITLATRYEGKQLSNPNDTVVAKDNSIYFTDPAYGVTAAEKELPNAVYRLKNNKLTRLVEDMDRPNGLAFSPDQKILYIADSSPSKMQVRAYDVLSDGTLANGRLFADLRSKDQGAPDGMKVDARGDLWIAGPGGVWVFSPESVLIGVIPVPETPTNLAFGGSDGKTLFITAQTGVYRLPVKVEGIRP